MSNAAKSRQVPRQVRWRTWRGWMAMAALVACVPGAVSAQAQTIPPGDASMTVRVDGIDLEVFIYRPTGCAPRLLLMVFHGVSRNAGTYRDYAAPLADRVCAVVVAPLFDERRFPRDLYQYGGVTREPAGRRTIDLVETLADWSRMAAGRRANGAALPLVLLGHSAGAQFVDRVAAFSQIPAAAFIVANPSTWVLPNETVAAPFGLGGSGDAGGAALRAYLARPVTVLLGQDDHGTAHLAMGEAAMAQGDDRYARGTGAFAMAQAAARAHGWPFGWTLAEVPGVGHDARAMFASPAALAAGQRVIGP